MDLDVPFAVEDHLTFDALVGLLLIDGPEEIKTQGRKVLDYTHITLKKHNILGK